MVTVQFHESPLALNHAIFTLTGAGKSRQRNAETYFLEGIPGEIHPNTCCDSACMEMHFLVRKVVRCNLRTISRTWKMGPRICLPDNPMVRHRSSPHTWQKWSFGHAESTDVYIRVSATHRSGLHMCTAAALTLIFHCACYMTTAKFNLLAMAAKWSSQPAQIHHLGRSQSC